MHLIDSAPPTVVRATRLAVTGSNPGPDSTLPAYRPIRAMTTSSVGADASPQMRARVARGRLRSPLPYGVQSDYDRGDRRRDLPAVTLDNGILRATVLPTLGGRVWSLRDLRADRELLLVPERLRFAGFALTDAWFAGGIEWNLGSTGHATTTCRPMHAAVVDSPTGQALRLWEWERTRDLVLVIDLTLAGDRLLASTRVINPDPEPKPLYYWTNIAVPETPGTRVLTPATHAWRTSYSGSLDLVPVPHPEGPVDISYPAASSASADYFFDVADQAGRSITAVEPDGTGFAQTSTAEFARPQAVPLGPRTGRPPVAALAGRRPEVCRDPGRRLRDAVGARSDRRRVGAVLDRGVRPGRARPGRRGRSVRGSSGSCGGLRRGCGARRRSGGVARAVAA